MAVKLTPLPQIPYSCRRFQQNVSYRDYILYNLCVLKENVSRKGNIVLGANYFLYILRALIELYTWWVNFFI